MIIYNVLRSIRLLADSADSFAANCVAGIEANTKHIAEQLGHSLMLVTGLSPHIGYDKAAAVAKKAMKDGTSLKAAALALGYVSAKDFDRWVDPRKMIGPG